MKYVIHSSVAVQWVHAIDYLLTWNCKHLANAQIARRITLVCQRLGHRMPIINPMKHVCQRGSRDCGVAVAAMVAGIPYDQVLNRWFGCLTVEDGIREIAMWRLLEDITQGEWIICSLRAPLPQVGDHSFEDCPVAVVIVGDDGTRHYVAVDGCEVHDPLLPAGCLLSEYPNRGWRVHAVVKPGRTAIWHPACKETKR